MKLRSPVTALASLMFVSAAQSPSGTLQMIQEMDAAATAANAPLLVAGECPIVNNSDPTKNSMVYFTLAPKSIVVSSDIDHDTLFDIGKTGMPTKYMPQGNPRLVTVVGSLPLEKQTALKEAYARDVGLALMCLKQLIALHKITPEHDAGDSI